MYVGLWGIPLLLSVLILVAMFRPTSHDTYGIEGLFRLFWLIPLLFVWCVYFGLRVLLGGS